MITVNQATCPRATLLCGSGFFIIALDLIIPKHKTWEGIDEMKKKIFNITIFLVLGFIFNYSLALTLAVCHFSGFQAFLLAMAICPICIDESLFVLDVTSRKRC
jgi:uncharacterized membrane protein SirB2